MSNYRTPRYYLDIAKSPDATPSELRQMAQSHYNFVRQAVASHPNTEPDVLASLVPLEIKSWNDQELAAAIAEHPHTPSSALSILAKCLVPVLDNGRGHQMGFKAGVLLCSNLQTPIEAIAAILQPDCAAVQFRKVVARESRRGDVLKILANDRSESVKKQALKNIQTLVDELV